MTYLEEFYKENPCLTVRVKQHHLQFLDALLEDTNVSRAEWVRRLVFKEFKRIEESNKIR